MSFALGIFHQLGPEKGRGPGSWIESEEVGGKVSCFYIGKLCGPANDGRPFDTGNGEVGDAAMSKIALEGEDIVTGLELAKIVSMSQGLNRK